MDISNMYLSAQMTSSSQSKARLPDFLIVGAMKAGTSSLHHILSKHERVFIPKGEIYFFDIDDIEQHPDFFVETSTGWSFHDFDRYFDDYLSWYSVFFRDAQENHIIGEHSTTYMASQKAPHRISNLLPNVRLIFMLRDPVSRTYSQYWHFVRTGRAVYDFEQTLQYTPSSLLQRSFYKKQIERYRKYFPEENIKIVIFEAFIKDVQGTIDDVSRFLGLESSIDVTGLATRQNTALVPRSSKLQMVYNHVFRKLAAQKYLDSHLPKMPANKPSQVLVMISKAFEKANLTDGRGYPRMRPKTERFLQELFAEENRGLSALIGVNVQKYWPYMRD